MFVTRHATRMKIPFLHWLKHAFAVEKSTTAAPTVSQAKLIDRVCREVVRRRMTLPAQMGLASSMPAHYLAGQLLRFFEPFLATLLDAAEIRDFASFLEQRGSVEYICGRLEELERTEEDHPGSESASNVDRKI